MSLPSSAGSGSAPGSLDARWKSLVARALDPDAVTGPLGDAIRLFGELGFTRHLADPANARDQCIQVSQTFESMLAHRGIPAETVDGFCFAEVPPFGQEAIAADHTAVRAVTTGAGKDDGSSEIAIDWTARQFDPVAPVPLIVPLADWRAFWRDLAGTGATQKGEAQASRRPSRRTRTAAHANGVEGRRRGRTAGLGSRECPRRPPTAVSSAGPRPACRLSTCS